MVILQQLASLQLALFGDVAELIFHTERESNKVQDIGIKNRTYYLFDDSINIKNFDPNNIKIDTKSHTKIFLFAILDM